MKKRNSAIELIKIFAMLLITISHSMPAYGSIDTYYCLPMGIASSNVGIVLLNVFRSFGEIGNIIFIICSAYFLLDSSKSKKEKIISIFSDCFVISMMYLVLALIFGIKIDILEIVRSFIPLSGGKYWFITCYIMLYIIHPILNMVINSKNKKELFRITMLLFMLYSVIQFVFRNFYYYNEFVGIILIYFIVGYIKQYVYVKNVNWIMIGIISIIMN